MMASAPKVDFKRDVLASEELVLALFLARWCPFCRSYLPIFRKGEGRGVRLAEVDISDYDNPLWDDYAIEVVPTLILFQGGKVLARADGRYLWGLEEADMERLLSMAEEKR